MGEKEPLRFMCSFSILVYIHTHAIMRAYVRHDMDFVLKRGVMLSYLHFMRTALTSLLRIHCREAEAEILICQLLQ